MLLIQVKSTSSLFLLVESRTNKRKDTKPKKHGQRAKEHHTHTNTQVVQTNDIRRRALRLLSFSFPLSLTEQHTSPRGHSLMLAPLPL